MKKEITYPFGINEIRFKRSFSAPSYRIFVALLIGWALTVEKHTVSQMILTMRLHHSRHCASIYRFLAKGRWSVDLVSYCLFRVLVETLNSKGSEILVVVDDTLNKQCGKVICGAGWQYDGSAPKLSKQKGYGVCFVIIGLAIRLPGISDRMFCLPFAARLWWPPKAKVKPQSFPYKKKPELALVLIEQTHSWLHGAHASGSSMTLATVVIRSLRDVPKAYILQEGCEPIPHCSLLLSRRLLREEAGLVREVADCRTLEPCLKTRTWSGMKSGPCATKKKSI